MQAFSINSSSVHVTWDPPLDRERNGVIRGYQVYVQPKTAPEAPSQYYTMGHRFNTGNGDITSYNVTGLQPDTRYLVQVAALTRKGDGTRSEAVKVKTPGGVPSRPTIDLKLVSATIAVFHSFFCSKSIFS